MIEHKCVTFVHKHKNQKIKKGYAAKFLISVLHHRIIPLYTINQKIYKENYA